MGTFDASARYAKAAVDICLPPPKNALEEHLRWMNRLSVELKTAPWTRKVKIEVR